MMMSKRWFLFVIINVIVVSFFSLTMVGVYFPPIAWDLWWEEEIFDLPWIVVFLSFPIFFTMAMGSIFLYLDFKRQRTLAVWLMEIKDRGMPTASTTEEVARNMSSSSTLLKEVSSSLQGERLEQQRKVNEQSETMEREIQTVVENERNRLARELHDSVSQQLFGASMLLSTLQETSKDTPLASLITKTQGIVHQSQLEMRALLLHLRPVPLKDKTLQEGMYGLMHELEAQTSFEFVATLEDFTCEKGVEDHIFRIFQEAISNIIRHANATKVEVQLLQRNHQLLLFIKDNGKGFEMVDNKLSSYGLSTMKERAEEIGGFCKVVSVIGEGTQVSVTVPLEEREGDQ
ncbi:sensor histidine kinase [Mangrovibacillus cuniculi]|uniref:histidine kinase n=1 Tax=Mangrovibacillus cuniculi TaxID=2593652 RepID=A0A7S8C967_9BACI|nr:sensor histidine kinase [Mangrovibacillus cuniculi]QPC45737.1 sensor histidine kinase [Mangrovibacillus cuniculi]